MISEILRRIFSSDVRRENVEERQLRALKEYEANTATDEKEKAVDKTVASLNVLPYEKDIQALVRKYGELKSGMSIEMTLHEALQIMPRKRHKADAYKGVQSQLNRMGVKFSIVNPLKNNRL